jgi:hypothetical protein
MKSSMLIELCAMMCNDEKKPIKIFSWIGGIKQLNFKKN